MILNSFPNSSRNIGRCEYKDPNDSNSLFLFDDQYYQIFELEKAIQAKVDPSGDGILSLPRDFKRKVKCLLRKFGIDVQRPYITLHVRESGFRGNGRLREYRNASLENYKKTIEYLISQGFSIIRMGDSSMRPIRRNKFIFDYANSCFKSAENDIIILAGAKFHIGSSSGLSLVPQSLGVPTAFTNWWPFCFRPWSPKAETLEKNLLEIDSNEVIKNSQEKEKFSKVLSPELLDFFGYSIIENDEDQILDFIKKFLERIR